VRYTIGATTVHPALLTQEIPLAQREKTTDDAKDTQHDNTEDAKEYD
jgi:hypothetical protein